MSDACEGLANLLETLGREDEAAPNSDLDLRGLRELLELSQRDLAPSAVFDLWRDGVGAWHTQDSDDPVSKAVPTLLNSLGALLDRIEALEGAEEGLASCRRIRSRDWSRLRSRQDAEQRRVQRVNPFAEDRQP